VVQRFTKRTAQESPLELSVIICTRDRGNILLDAVRSVLADIPTDGSAEVLVVDQGSDDTGEQSLVSLLENNSRLRYLRDISVGLSKARNAGIRATTGALIAFTDDDCTVEPGWATAIKEGFAAQPVVGLLFGFVACADYDPAQGFVPAFEAVEGALDRRRLFLDTGHWGMGANMALRRSAYERIGPFDELLGAGAPLRSAEDVDYVFRALGEGVGIYHCADARVIHAGFRPWAEASTLIKGAWLGIGAMYAKQVRRGSVLASILLCNDLWGHVGNIARNVLRRRRPLGVNALIYELKGFWRGWWLPLDRRGSRTYLVFHGDKK
jgi:GT2 family glycosyltransferase